MSNAQKTDGTGRSELRNTLEGTEHGKRRKSGTYNAGVKDLASAYVLSIYGWDKGLWSNEGIGSRVVTQARRRIKTEY